MVHDENATDVDESLRARVYKLSDLVIAHESAIREGKVRLDMLAAGFQAHQTTVESSINALRSEGAKRSDLASLETLVTTKLEALHAQNTLKLQNITDNLEPMRKAIYSVAWLIIAAVIVALLALVVVRPDLREVKQALPAVGAHP